MDILQEAVLYKSDRGPSVLTSLACACEVLSGVTAFIWNK